MARGPPSFASLDSTLARNAMASSLAMLVMAGDVSSRPFAPGQVALTVRSLVFGGVQIRGMVDNIMRWLMRR